MALLTTEHEEEQAERITRLPRNLMWALNAAECAIRDLVQWRIMEFTGNGNEAQSTLITQTHIGRCQ
ncbi:hypothetical protein PROAA_3530003 [Candidatus Propionivibrio aalborgensis]|uniref:Uncharacterized protein n=1 Tax=Candidatus Propionivibrio aalborgensis TaxID=1860101 RepID=A0A1A8XYW1_9RHOO|nr:hypothetical protein PROAA_3530003 [Candidatus Propionivibrio aalborgensis]